MQAARQRHGNSCCYKRYKIDFHVPSLLYEEIEYDSIFLFTHVENGKASAWDEISQAFNAKKAELSQEENGWSKNDGSVRSSWSYRGLRGSALGPVVARFESARSIRT